MPPRSQKPEEKEDPFQAVVIADTFDDTFENFARTQPRCLLPLLGIPLIDYTLEYLARCGIQEVFVISAFHSDQLESYLSTSKWWIASTGFRKFSFLKSIATSVGDVMRDLDQKALMSGDFLVVSADVVGDFPIEEALKQHRLRREKDKNAIMTMVLREGGQKPSPSSSSNYATPTFAIDPLHSRCLAYGEPTGRFYASFDLSEDLLEHPEIDIRQDLMDCRIDICTPDVLGLWSDNFDNQSPRKDFLHGILKDYELNGKTAHTYIVRNHYAARIEDEATHAAVARDLRHGRCMPMSFDMKYETSMDEEKFSTSRLEHILSRSSSTSSLSTDASIPSSASGLELNMTNSPSHSRHASMGAASAFSDEDNDPTSNKMYQNEAVNTILHRLTDDADIGDIQVELMGLRFANNVNEDQVRKATAAGITHSMFVTVSKGANGTASEVTSRTIRKYKGLIQRENAGDVSMESQVEFLVQVQKSLIQLASRPPVAMHGAEAEDIAGKILLFLCKELYDQEMFSEDVFISWWDDQSNVTAEGGTVQVRKATEQFITWLKEAESESDEDEDEG